MGTDVLKPMVMIDRMMSEEAETVASLFRDVLLGIPYYNDAAKTHESAKYSSESLCESMAVDPDSVLVARTEQTPIGFCISRPDDGVIWLAWFGVHAAHRREGIGSALLEKLEETVRRGRSHKIWCDCRTDNHESLTVLRRHNYMELCTVRRHWYGQDFILWEKFLG